ncbi:hypothetical protein J2790_002179 [Paenarthrobacter nicotinovorans]|uniref:hypothetical protein n=1 Tax=Micrococcaceae TaxID=1268 RepID=UPI0011143EAA|nr:MULTISPECIES: hypothetical protein [Micrococcaceae]MDR6437036.1 hypothetical protein [Paenarthrobacter nicotinovorans]
MTEHTLSLAIRASPTRNGTQRHSLKDTAAAKMHAINAAPTRKVFGSGISPTHVMPAPKINDKYKEYRLVTSELAGIQPPLTQIAETQTVWAR